MRCRGLRERKKDGRLMQVSSDRLGTSDTLSLRLTLCQQLVLSHALQCLPRQICTSRQYVHVRFNMNVELKPPKPSLHVCTSWKGPLKGGNKSKCQLMHINKKYIHLYQHWFASSSSLVALSVFLPTSLIYFLCHSGAGYRSHQCALSTAEDLAWAGHGKSPPVPAL